MTEKVLLTRVHFHSAIVDLNEFDKVATERRLSRADLLRESMLNTITTHKQNKGMV